MRTTRRPTPRRHAVTDTVRSHPLRRSLHGTRAGVHNGRHARIPCGTRSTWRWHIRCIVKSSSRQTSALTQSRLLSSSSHLRGLASAYLTTFEFTRGRLRTSLPPWPQSVPARHGTYWRQSQVSLAGYHPDLQGFDQDQSPLAQWGSLWYWKFELDWHPDLMLPLRQWFAKPNPPGDSRCLNIPVSFEPDAFSSTVEICVVSPKLGMNDLAAVAPGSGQLWRLTGGWPWVFVRMSNVNDPGVVELNTVGRTIDKAVDPSSLSVPFPYVCSLSSV